MKPDAIKLELFEWLAKINDEGVLKALQLYKKSSETQDWFDALTPEQLARFEKGVDDYKKGRTIKSKDLWKRYGRKG